MARSGRRVLTASERRLLTVLFTDIVGSTELAVEMGDARWPELVARHHRIVRRELKRFGGREIDTAGDGFFATFDKPTQAVRCAAAVAQAVRELGIEIRAGLPLGEVEIAGGKVGGISVHTGARVLAAAPGEVLGTGTLRELVAGAGLAFDARGTHELKGVPGEWHLFALGAVDGRPVEPRSDAEAAAERGGAIAPPSLLRRSRTPAVVVGIAVLLLVAALLVMDDQAPPPGGAGPTEPPLGSVVQVDPSDGTTLHTIPDVVVRHGGGNPKIVVGEGGVWVRSDSLVHLDPQTGRVEGEGPLFETTDNPRADRSVEVGFRAIWVGGELEGDHAVLFRWNPATDERLSDTRIRSSIEVNDVALGGGAVWVAFSDGRLVKLDPNTREVEAEARAAPLIDGVVFGAGGVWVLDVASGTLTRIDPRTLEGT